MSCAWSEFRPYIVVVTFGYYRFLAIGPRHSGCRRYPPSVHYHYDDVRMGARASPITSLTVDYSNVYSDADQRKHQSSASLAFVWGIHRDRWIPRTKGQWRGKCFHLMTSSWFRWQRTYWLGYDCSLFFKPHRKDLIHAYQTKFLTDVASVTQMFLYYIFQIFRLKKHQFSKLLVFTGGFSVVN